eukprot:CAMPEP_0119493902 /NCGR_PEP_ID=MMETSP1344-20130328/18018_1 /TAXON_ID=236787 /ORGANISM="Florenciella parvula, Strain CCMP2471" /LENGTH=41 /DNA_ID= /DNA_START= /DNA_END= /DNA_ORIENTATION=
MSSAAAICMFEIVELRLSSLMPNRAAHVLSCSILTSESVLA